MMEGFGDNHAMIALEVLASLLLLCSVIPATLFCVNLWRYRLPRFGPPSPERIAVLIPARDEEENIGDCLRSVLASREVDLEVLVLDDDSADRTASIVLEIAANDRRVRLLHSEGLPSGWNGKQHACWHLAHANDAPLMLFLDADVRLHPWAIARCVAALRKHDVALLSGFPRQVTVGFLEKMLLPLIHFVLLGFLPLGRMRKTSDPAYAAGCGQFFLVDSDAYFAAGGHGGIRETRHDGLRLPRLLREHGYFTDIVDLTTLAHVRMYTSARSVWLGLAKNATEGIGSPRLIVPFSLLLVLGQILPTLALFACVAMGVSTLTVGATFDDPLAVALIAFAVLVSVFASALPRMLAVRRFQQPVISAILHPLGVFLLLTVQWYALCKQVFGRPVGWRARSYASSTGEEV